MQTFAQQVTYKLCAILSQFLRCSYGRCSSDIVVCSRCANSTAAMTQQRIDQLSAFCTTAQVH